MTNYHAIYGNGNTSSHNTTTQREAISQATRQAEQNNTHLQQIQRQR
jgi:hypothetical protein